MENRRQRIRKNEAAKRRPVFSALPLRGRPLAYTSTARVARKAASSENPDAYFAGKAPRFSGSFAALATPAAGGQGEDVFRIQNGAIGFRFLNCEP